MKTLVEMFCRLCLKESISEFRSLYDSEGQQNEIYLIARKYFDEELDDTVKTGVTNDKNFSRVICEDCWGHISEFHNFQEMVLMAQKQYKNLMQFEQLSNQNVKVEVIEDEPPIFDILFSTVSDEDVEQKADPCPDPFDVTEKDYSLEKMEDSDQHTVTPNNGDSSSDDDKPLIRRVHKKLLRTKIKRTKLNPTITKRSQKKFPKRDESTEQRGRKSISKTKENDAFIAENWKRELNCGECDVICGNFTQIVAHFRDLHDGKKAYVVCCDRKYYNRFHLVEHLNLHLNPELFKCEICGKCSTNRRNLNTHMKVVHPPEKPERIHECEVCHKRFAKVAILREHMDTHATGSKDYVCPHCNKGFVLEKRLNIHVRNVHSTIFSSVCEQCGKSCRGPYALKAHIREQHEGVEKRKWPCDQCDAKLHSNHSLKRHKRVAHNDGSTVYVCSECGKVALTADALRSHKKYVHQKERKYKCNICDKAFKVAIVLREHMTIHTGQALYQCPHCPKTFRVSANMHHHRKRVHPKEWAEKRQHRLLATHTDLSQIANEVVM